MYFKQKSNIMYRNYGDFGYITDNRNFGYGLPNDVKECVGDKIVSKSGAIFLSVLERKPQSIDELVNRICKHFISVNRETVMHDAIEFYLLLESEGFVTSGTSSQECIEKDIPFKYKKFAQQSGGYVHVLQIKKNSQDYFDDYFDGQPQLLSLHIEITSRCNERCVHCYIPHESKNESMSSQMFYDILDQGMELNILNVTISGGEPLLHKDFMDFLKKCNEYNLSVNVLSNLTLLSDDIIKEMKKNPLLSVQTSLYSMDKNIHDNITQKSGSFLKTKSAILALIENNIPVQISCPIIKQNVKCYEEVVAWGETYNINVNSDYTIIAKYDHSVQNLKYRLSIDEIEKFIIKKIDDDSKYLDLMEKEYINKKNILPSDYLCSVCHSSLCISETGNVYPCAGWQDYVIKNIKEMNLRDIWYNEAKVNYLRNIRRKDISECLQCTAKEFCTPCMVRNANESISGNPLEVNRFFCHIAELHKRVYVEHLAEGM